MNNTMPTGSDDRKGVPMATGLLDYFPGALAEVAKVSKAGNDKHNPGEPLHWARGKSADHADTIMRHLADRGLIDPEDGLRHSAKVAWRALALLQEELEAAGAQPGRGSVFPRRPHSTEAGDVIEVAPANAIYRDPPAMPESFAKVARTLGLY